MPAVVRPSFVALAVLVSASSAAAQSYVWSDRTDIFIPRIVPVMVDQPNRHRVLVYGGWQENGVRNDTWEWDGRGWIHRQPVHDAGARAGAAAVYDEVRGRVLLISGASDFFNGRVADNTSTWEWNGDDWSSIDTATKPPQSIAAGAVWDPSGNRMLVFGGFGKLSAAPGQDGGGSIIETQGTDDFWSFEGSDWRQIPRTSPWPSPRGLTSMTWDRARNRLVLHSGLDRAAFRNGQLTLGGGSASGSFASALGDTWEWDGASWALVEMPPLTQVGGSNLFWNPAANEVEISVDTLLAGALVPALYTYHSGDSWTLIGASQNEDAQRALTSVAFSSANQRPLLTGGVAITDSGLPSTSVSLLEELEGITFETEPPVASLVPLQRAAGATAADGSVILFGGLSGGAFTGATYRWNGGRWTALPLVIGTDPMPSPRAGAAFAAAGQELVLFGGIVGGGQRLDDTWLWNGTRWAPGPAGPLPREDAAAFMLGDAAYLFGGLGPGGSPGVAPLLDTWRYRDGAWTALSSSTTPGPRGRSCAASRETSALLAGGEGDGVWSFDGNRWTRASDALYGERTGCAMASALSQTIVIGGSGSATTEDAIEIAPESRLIEGLNDDARLTPPPRRRLAVFTPNPVTGGLLLTGGVRDDNEQQLADTWQLRLLGQACTNDSACGNGAFCTEGVCCEQSSCGPCGTCASPDLPGLCQPSPAGPAAGCDGSLACNESGHCRVAPGGTCGDDSACASGACIKSADAGAGLCCDLGGCALQCKEDGRTLRNPDGTGTDCAPYGCEGNSCKKSCASVTDCAGGAICNTAGACIPPENATPSDSSCGCRAAGGRGRPIALGLALLAFVAARFRKRRRP